MDSSNHEPLDTTTRPLPVNVGEVAIKLLTGDTYTGRVGLQTAMGISILYYTEENGYGHEVSMFFPWTAVAFLMWDD